MSNHLNVSVVGTGYWGKHYVRILGPQCKLAVDPSEAAREKMVSLHPDLITSGKVEDAANNDDIQAWIVCTPAASHYNVVKAGLLAGKHVLVEKPLTLNVDHAKELISIAKENQLILMVGHTFLFNSRVWHFDRIIHDNELFGDLRYISARRTNLGPVRNDCSVLWDLAPHDVSMILALNSGSLATQVSCTGQSILSNSEYIDVAFMTITFNNNTIAHIHVSWCDPHKVRETTAIGSKMKCTFDDMDNFPITMYHQSVDIDPQNQERSIFSDGSIEKPVVQSSEPLKNQVIDFLGRCTTNTAGASGAPTHMSSLDEMFGLKVVEILIAAETSVLQGGKPVSL